MWLVCQCLYASLFWYLFVSVYMCLESIVAVAATIIIVVVVAVVVGAVRVASRARARARFGALVATSVCVHFQTRDTRACVRVPVPPMRQCLDDRRRERTNDDTSDERSLKRNAFKALQRAQNTPEPPAPAGERKRLDCEKLHPECFVTHTHTQTHQHERYVLISRRGCLLHLCTNPDYH